MLCDKILLNKNYYIMKNSYLFKLLGFVFALGLLFTGLKTQAQNQNFIYFDGTDDFVKYTDDSIGSGLLFKERRYVLSSSQAKNRLQ